MSIICKIRRTYTALRMLLKGHKDAWEMTRFTGHNWYIITTIYDTQLEQCKTCKDIAAIIIL